MINGMNSGIEWKTYLVIPVVNDISGWAVLDPPVDGGNEILNRDRIPAITSNIDVSAKWVPNKQI